MIHEKCTSVWPTENLPQPAARALAFKLRRIPFSHRRIHAALSSFCLAILAVALGACGGGSGSQSTATGSAPSGSGSVVAPPLTPVLEVPPLALSPSSLATAKDGELVERTKSLIRERAKLRSSGGLAVRTDFSVDGRALAPMPAADSLAIPQATAAGGQLVWSTASASAMGAPAGVGSSTQGALAATPLRSGSTIQEAGVDEDDLLKTDGSFIYGLKRATWTSGKLEPDRLRTYRRQVDGSVASVGNLDLPVDPSTSTLMRGMVLSEEYSRLALVGESNTWFPRLPDCMPDRPCILPAVIAPGVGPGAIYSAPKTTLQWVDVSGNVPVAGDRLVMDGQLIGIRQIGRYVYLTLSYTPYLAADLLPVSTSAAELESKLGALRPDDILPRVQRGSAPSQRLVEERDCFLQPTNRSADLQIGVVLAFDAASPTSAWQAKCFFGGTQAIYMSPENLYLATTRDEIRSVGGLPVFSTRSRTDIHKFGIRGGQVSYRGSGEVAGHLGWDRERAPYRMGEYAGDLRVISFTGASGWSSPADAGSPTLAPSPATLTILRENPSSGTLETLSTLPNPKRPEALGLPGEQIYAVRFQSDKAYLVTFRQVDPLYVLDLSNPADPKAAGELKMPGYSDYLFPLPNSLLLGVGKEASPQGFVGGVKVALFDVRDPSSPKELKSFTFGDRGSSSGLDFSSRGINLLTVPLSNPAQSATPAASQSIQAALVRIALPLTLRPGSQRGTGTAQPDVGTVGPGLGIAPVPGGGSFVALPAVDWLCDDQGLQLLEVDTREAMLKKHRWIASIPANCSTEISSDRSVQIGQHVYYWTRGDLRDQAW